MKLAVNKMPGHIPGGGFHYLLHPIAMQSAEEAALFELMGYVILDIADDAKGERLLRQAQAALQHQVEVAVLTEEELKK